MNNNLVSIGSFWYGKISLKIVDIVKTGSKKFLHGKSFKNSNIPILYIRSHY